MSRRGGSVCPTQGTVLEALLSHPEAAHPKEAKKWTLQHSESKDTFAKRSIVDLFSPHFFEKNVATSPFLNQPLKGEWNECD